MDEFSLISRYFRPLTGKHPGSLGLADDAAVMDIPAGMQLVATKDAITQGVHFLGSEPPGLIARKLLRVNLSDLAAMGAKPMAYLLAIMLPRETEASWVRKFAAGLAEDQKTFGITLVGGDTIATKGPLSFSITALGLVLKNAGLKRSNAKPGDHLYVSGTLGDSAMGLRILQRTIRLPLASSSREFLRKRYLLPEPRLALGEALHGIASACMDVSDGLVQDLNHICQASHCGAVIESAKLPLSAPAQALVAQRADLLTLALTGGDDYELLLSVPPKHDMTVRKMAAQFNVPLTRIGQMDDGKDVRVLDTAGKPMRLARMGYKHF